MLLVTKTSPDNTWSRNVNLQMSPKRESQLGMKESNFQLESKERKLKIKGIEGKKEKTFTF